MIDAAVFPGLQGGPHDNSNAAKAVAFKEALHPSFSEYAHQIVRNARALADELMAQGIKLVTDGTDNHLCLIDLRPLKLEGQGKEVQVALDEAAITTNRNTVPFEPVSPFNPSGVRIGTPAVTTRGMRESEMKMIAQGIAKAMSDFSASRLTNHHVPPKIMEAQNVPIIQRFHFLVSGTPSLKIGRTILYPHYQ